MKNIGIDIIEINRIKKSGIEKIAKHILSHLEYEIYNKITNIKTKYSFLAGRWAVKEAIFKAYQIGNLQNNYSDWTILNDTKKGFPYIKNNHKTESIVISISHSENYAIALAILL
ncbi:holo-ACP synthase [Candidatus Phytoplasma phoenicium]|uniref:Holo-[acyl-carrier protein] synthase n=1 Tax=Candidatus Phytoplasma phoenicium TaxID=198422 RepID=A0A0L0MJY4_9MOLU|nr:holo-ACP synthase [Candidatus Phytoplasma phoenicium]KND62683.1 Holo-[acyl-carrier protein] synthase [Candidatus Phytoplasma phoenicium]